MLQLEKNRIRYGCLCNAAKSLRLAVWAEPVPRRVFSQASALIVEPFNRTLRVITGHHPISVNLPPADTVGLG